LHCIKLILYICFINLKTKTMKTKHTQGEWEYLKLTYTNEFEISNGKTRSAVVPYTDDEGLANAKLIAAAPKLLQGLIDLKSQLIDGGFNETSVTISGIDLLIKEATE